MVQNKESEEKLVTEEHFERKKNKDKGKSDILRGKEVGSRTESPQNTEPPPQTHGLLRK